MNPVVKSLLSGSLSGATTTLNFTPFKFSISQVYCAIIDSDLRAVPSNINSSSDYRISSLLKLVPD